MNVLENALSILGKEDVLDTKEYKAFKRVKELETTVTETLRTRKRLSAEKKLSLINCAKALSEHSFFSYFKQSFHPNNPLVYGRHIELICDILTLADKGVFRGEKGFTKLMFFLPPRHLKSTTITESFPSWFMSKNLGKCTIVASYGDDLASKAGQRNRDKVGTIAKSIFDVDVEYGMTAKDNWKLKNGGTFIASGILGGITGFGADLMVIDDPIKNRKEAESKHYKDMVWAEYGDTLKTRLHSGGIEILIMTRWSDDDLAGRILKDENGEWLVVNLPAECESSDDLLGRELNQALWIENGYDNSYFDNFRANARAWASLFQQRPRVSTGNLFKRSNFQYFTVEDNYYVVGDRRYFKTDCTVFQTIDTAMTIKETSDFTAIGTWIVTPQFDLLLLDMLNTKIEIPEQTSLTLNMRARFKPNFQAIENKQSGIGVHQDLTKKGIPIRTLSADTDKLVRSYNLQILYENKKVYHLEGARWLGEFEEQLLGFDGNGSNHDDMVDVSSYAGILLEELAQKKNNSIEDRYSEMTGYYDY